MKKGKGLRSSSWSPQNSHGDVKYRMGNIVCNILMAAYRARGAWNAGNSWGNALQSVRLSNRYAVRLKLYKILLNVDCS